jgi:hypothetical protein
MPSIARGTDGSNPSPSSGESIAKPTFVAKASSQAGRLPPDRSQLNLRHHLVEVPREPTIRQFNRSPLQCQEPTFTGPPPNRHSRPFSVTQLRVRNGSSCPKAVAPANRRLRALMPLDNGRVRSSAMPPLVSALTRTAQPIAASMARCASIATSSSATWHMGRFPDVLEMSRCFARQRQLSPA